MKFLITIKKNHKIIFAATILIVAFLFSRLPFFIWMPLPLIFPDTFDYYAVVQNLMNGSFTGFGILPPGYILFLYLMELLFTKTFFILIIQNIFSLLVCIFLISVITKYYKNLTIPVAIALSIYMMDSYTLRYDFALLTESIYRNSLIAVTGLLLLIINSRKKLFWFLFSVSLILPPLIRSNGLYIYFLLLLIIIFLLKNKFSLKYYLMLFLPIIILNLIWSVFNYSTEKKFIPGNPNRLNTVVNDIYGDKPNSANNIKSKASLFIDLTTNISKSDDRPQFYYTFLYDTYCSYYISDIIHDSAYKRSDWTIPIDKSLRKIVYKEIYTEPNKYSEVIADFNISTSHNLWLKAYHVYYKIHSFLFSNYLWLLLFFTVYFISAWQFVRSRLKNINAFVVFSICSIHFMAILSLTFFGWFRLRYIQVSEFIVYLAIALSPLLFIKNKESNKS